MKKILVASVLALALVAGTQQPASAWCSAKFSIGLNYEYSGGNNNFFWGLYKSGQVPEGYGAPMGGYYAPMPPMAPPAFRAPAPFIAPAPTLAYAPSSSYAPPQVATYPATRYYPQAYPANYYPSANYYYPMTYSYPASYYPMSYSYGYPPGFSFYGQ
jgi:hypothetical protein